MMWEQTNSSKNFNYLTHTNLSSDQAAKNIRLIIMKMYWLIEVLIWKYLTATTWISLIPLQYYKYNSTLKKKPVFSGTRRRLNISQTNHLAQQKCVNVLSNENINVWFILETKNIFWSRQKKLGQEQLLDDWMVI